jgi:sodium-dependent dicarboxylate transporter 2/3/5
MNEAMIKSTNLKKYLWFIVATVAMVFVIILPLPDTVLKIQDAVLTGAGRISLGVLIFCLILWITEPIPFHITGFIGIILLTILKADTFSNIVKQGFGNDTVVFFIGVLAISSCITKSGLGQRVSMFILSKTGNKTSNILLGFLIAGTLISMWVTDMAVAAMLMPLAKAILEEEQLKPLKSNFGKALMISCAWGALIGGIATPAGCGANPLAIGFIYDMTGIEVTFLEWMVYGVPCSLLLIIPTWWVLLAFFKPEIIRISKTNEELKAKYKAMPPMNHSEKATAVIFLITAAVWISSSWLGDLLGIKIPTSLPAVLGACLFFFPGSAGIKWKDVEHDISWSSIILIAAGISLGIVIYQSGAAEWLSMLLFSNIARLGPILQIMLIVFIISLLKVGLSSNTVTATVIIPILIAMIQKLNLPVLGIIIPAALTLSLAFILVTSTPTNVIPYSAGYFKIADMAKAGIALTVITSVIIALAIFGIGNLTGIY